jgi:hypothetical protein
MEKSLEVRIQHFAETMTNRIQELESKLLVGQCQQEERKCMILSECCAELLEKFEYIFEDILYTEN